MASCSQVEVRERFEKLTPLSLAWKFRAFQGGAGSCSFSSVVSGHEVVMCVPLMQHECQEVFA